MGRRKDRTLTSEALSALLSAFHPDRLKAGELYEQWRERLIWIFGRDNVLAAEMADDALDRAARHLAEGAPIRNLAAFLLSGIAGKMTYERGRVLQKAALPLDAVPPDRQPVTNPDVTGLWPDASAVRHERMLECIEMCLERLHDPERALILEYHWGEGGIRAAHERLADRLGIKRGALRARAMRARLKLERCITPCLTLGEVSP